MKWNVYYEGKLIDSPIEANTEEEAINYVKSNNFTAEKVNKE